MMYMGGTMWGLEGSVMGNLGCTDTPLPEAWSHALPGPNRQAINHLIMGLCTDTTPSIRLLKWVYVYKEKFGGLTHGRNHDAW